MFWQKPQNSKPPVLFVYLCLLLLPHLNFNKFLMFCNNSAFYYTNSVKHAQQCASVCCHTVFMLNFFAIVVTCSVFLSSIFLLLCAIVTIYGKLLSYQKPISTVTIAPTKNKNFSALKPLKHHNPATLPATHKNSSMINYIQTHQCVVNQLIYQPVFFYFTPTNRHWKHNPQSLSPASCKTCFSICCNH